MTDLGRALDVCGYKLGDRFSVGVIADGAGQFACFSTIAEAEIWLGSRQGNKYFCPNPVRAGCEGRPKADDVLEARVLLMDCDPAPDEAAARASVLKLAAVLQGVGCRPAVVDSGRGTQAWVRTALGPGPRRRLARGLAASCALTGAKYDGTFDPARLMRLPGTVNLKTGRMARILEDGSGRAVDDAVLERLGLPQLDELEAKKARADVRPPTEEDKLLIAGAAKSVWDQPAQKGERSKRDFRLVLALLKAGATEEQACRLLYAMPGSKAAEDGRGDDYWTSTLASVRRHMQEQERLRLVAKELPEAAKDDPGAPFEPAALDALLLAREEDEADWQRLRAELKKSKVAIRALEDAMAARQRAGQDYVPAELRFVAQDSKRIGWFRRDVEGSWVPVDASEARSIMRASGQDPDVEIEAQTNEPWQLVNEPFQAEDLDGRRWNKDGARLSVEPKEGPHPTWDALLGHVGASLDPIVAADDWCVLNGIRTGGQYLLAWFAAMFQRPRARTAFLFLHGPQESGKSTLHEAIKPLLTRGYAEAGHALRSREGFNGEIANAVLCVIEEIDLSDPKRETHERVKKWVTGETISVRAMYRQAYDLPNNTHWIHAANPRRYMAVLPEDTRITEIFVDKPEHPIPKKELMERLAGEAPGWLFTVTKYPLPTPTGRLFIPALQTIGKSEQACAAGSELEVWLGETDYLEVPEDELVKRFLGWLDGPAKMHWDKQRVMRELPAEARRDRRLAGAVREMLTGHPGMSTSQILDRLPTAIRAEWRSSVRLGHAMSQRIAPKLKWLERVTIRGLDVWRGGGLSTSSPTTTTDSVAPTTGAAGG